QTVAHAHRYGQRTDADPARHVTLQIELPAHNALPSTFSDTRCVVDSTAGPDRPWDGNSWAVKAPRRTEGGQSLPTRDMLPAGAGTPPAAARVSAQVSGRGRATTGAARMLPPPSASTVKPPAGIGAALPLMAQSS